MKPQKAFARMDLEIFRTEIPHRRSCTALALAAYLEGADASPTLLRAATNEMFTVAWEMTGGVFGVKTPALRAKYAEFGFRFVNALIDGERFPRNCILWLVNKETDEGHTVARRDGRLIDSDDCRTEPYEIRGYFVPA